MLPDRSLLIGQKLVENAKIQKFKCDILSNFQTMCRFTKRVDKSLNSQELQNSALKVWISLIDVSRQLTRVA